MRSCALGLTAGSWVLGDAGAGTGRQGRGADLQRRQRLWVRLWLLASDQLHLFAGGGGPPQHYVGAINKFGVDIGYLQGGVIVWTVVAPTANLAPGSLTGTYAGATGSATVGVGVGANVLVGGSGNSIALQPVSIEGTTGLNVAAGIAEMTLTFQPG